MSFFTTITMFGAAFLLSALPFIILVSTFANRRIEDDLTQHLGLNARAGQIVGRLFETSSERSISAVVLAVALTMAGTLGVASSVQNVYEQVFGKTRHRRANVMRLLVWVGGLLGWLVTDSIISALTHGRPGGLALDGVGVFAATTAFFWWSMRFLLAGNLRWRTLLIPAITTSAFWIGLEAFAAAYFSSTITSDTKLYGSVGVVFSLLTWFIAIAAVVVLGALIGDVAQQRVVGRRSASGH